MKWIIPKTFTMVLLAIVLYETSANTIFFMLEGYGLFLIHLWIWGFPISSFIVLAAVNHLMIWLTPTIKKDADWGVKYGSDRR